MIAYLRARRIRRLTRRLDALLRERAQMPSRISAVADALWQARRTERVEPLGMGGDCNELNLRA